MSKRVNARELIGEHFKKHVGKVITTREILKVSGIISGARRIRELREAGWAIDTHNDDASLKPGEYRLKKLPVENTKYEFSTGITGRIRAQVLERNGYTCQMCGIGAGEIDDTGRKARLHIGHIIDKSHGGTDDLANLRAMCNQCNEGAKNITQEPPRYTWLLSQVRRAKNDDQKAILNWLEDKFKNK